WWFGDPFTSMEDALFDDLFRAHLHGAYRAMGVPSPRELDEPVASHKPAAESSPVSAPYAFISPHIGANHFYDWQGAGRYRVPRGAAMADTPLVATILFGFDRERLFLRLEPSDGRAAELMGARLEVEMAVGARRLRLVTEGESVRIDERVGDDFKERDR